MREYEKQRIIMGKDRELFRTIGQEIIKHKQTNMEVTYLIYKICSTELWRMKIRLDSEESDASYL